MKLERKTLLEIGIAGLLLYLVIHYWDEGIGVIGLIISAASPLVFGAVLAFVVNILMSFFERNLVKLFRMKKKGKWVRPLCMLLAFITVLLVLILIVRMIVPELSECIEVLIGAIPNAVRAAARWAEDTLNISGLVNHVMTDFQANQQKMQETITKGVNVVLYGAGSVMSVAVSAASTVVSSVITLFLGVVFAVHLLTGKERLGSQFKRLINHFLPQRINDRIRHVLRVLNESFRSYIVCQVTEACILGGLCTLGMMILRLDYPLMIGSLIGVTALIPIAGAYIGGGVGAIMLFSVDPSKALIFIIFLVVLQQIEGNVIYPRVAGSSLGLPGIWVLAAITIGGGLLGITGMLISVPLTTAFYRLLSEHISKKEAALSSKT
ncbi:MAG: AI-2E family transporter [Clostridiales bacterium]|nr:AI-2E family transporter [Clostridiales bacterium]